MMPSAVSEMVVPAPSISRGMWPAPTRTVASIAIAAGTIATLPVIRPTPGGPAR
jgi:hypothetical protein